MPWVRIHDGALDHPKFLGLIKWTDPFHLWVWGLSYTQRHLLDGFIPEEALPKASRKAAVTLVERRLWTRVDGGYQVHHYAHWNNTREFVHRQQAASRDRRERWNERRSSRDTGTRSGRDAGTASKPSQSTKPTNQVQKTPTESSARRGGSPRPTTRGRLTLHRWQEEALLTALGPHAGTFDLDEWLFALSAKADEEGLVIDRQALWPWVQAQLRAECLRRGLPVASDARSHLGQQTTRLLEAVARLEN